MLAGALDRTQAITNVLVRNRLKPVHAPVNIGRLKVNAKLLSVTKQDLELVGVVHLHRHIGAKEFGRVVDLDPRGVVGQERISSSVGFVKSVARKLFHQVKYFVGFGFGDVVLGRTCAKNSPVLGHFFGFFLAHRAAQHVRATQGIATQNLCGLHHLLLVDHDAVGL